MDIRKNADFMAMWAYAHASRRGKTRNVLHCLVTRRKRLITCDLYDLEQAFEDGWEESSKTIIDKACKWFESIDTDKYMDNNIFQMSDLIRDFKKAMEE